jgi:hypothetical protein
MRTTTTRVTLVTLALLIGAGSAQAQDFHMSDFLIAPGKTVNGVLEAGDNVMTTDDTYFDANILPVFSGRTYRISLTSSDFDAYLLMSDFVTGETADDDDSGPGTDSMLMLTAEGDGFFVVGANSLAKNTGRYTLEVDVLDLD